jgi:hypothetical protein
MGAPREVRLCPACGPPAESGNARRQHPIPSHRTDSHLAPAILPPVDACIDCAADDTVFPPHLATRLGISLTSMQKGQSRLIGGTIVNVNYTQVTLLLSDGYETCEWDTVVGFSSVPMQWALLGHAGFLEFFDVQLFGAQRLAIVTPNIAFAGQHVVHSALQP